MSKNTEFLEKGEDIYREIKVYLQGVLYAGLRKYINPYNRLVSRHGHRQAKSALVRMVGEEGSDSESFLDTYALDILRCYFNDHAGRDNDMIEHFIRWLEHPLWMIREDSLSSISNFPDDPRVFPLLSESMGTFPAGVVPEIIRLLVRVDWERAVPVLMDLVADRTGTKRAVECAAFFLATLSFHRGRGYILEQLLDRVKIELQRGEFASIHDGWKDISLTLHVLELAARQKIREYPGTSQRLINTVFTFLLESSVLEQVARTRLALAWTASVLTSHPSFSSGNHLSFLETEPYWEILTPHVDSIDGILRMAAAV